MRFRPAQIYSELEPITANRLAELANNPDTTRQRYDEAAKDAVMHSIAISLKRLADIADWLQTAKMRGEL